MTENDEKISVPLRPGWIRVTLKKNPRLTFWPATLALGTTLILWGLVASVILTVAGLIFLALAVAGWIGEMRHE